jgi:hypothetical protein
VKFLAILAMAMVLTACGPAPAPVNTQVEVPAVKEDGCTINSASKLVNEHTVGPIRNLQKDIVESGYSSKCTVNFDITVNGKEYHLTDSEEGLEQTASLCYYARERARENLLLDLGGTFSSEETIICRSHDTNN